MRTKKEGIVLVTLFSVLFLSSIVLAVDCPIPDTGQTKCYDHTQEIVCPRPGEPFYGQDANYAPCNPHSYTKLDENSDALPDEAIEWVMVRDNVTGLICENKTDDGSIHDKDNFYYNWYDAQDVFIATLNSQDFGGHNDWRLPTVKELTSIIDNNRYTPSINTTYFANTVSSYYWSSTTNAGSPLGAWVVGFDGGDVIDGNKSYGYGYVRAVRSGQCGSFGNYIDNGDGTVTDTDTGLMWQQDTASGYYNWQQALSYCEGLTLAEYADWRLPNKNELQSIVDYSKYGPAINTTYFPSTFSSPYWSSTTHAYDPSHAWDVYFSYGFVSTDYKSLDGYVRAVRGGQCESLDTSTTTTTTEKSTTTTTIPIPVPTSTSTISSTTTSAINICPIEMIYGEGSEEVEILKFIRDYVLRTTPQGQELIKLYYELSPAIVKAMEEDGEFEAQLKEMIDGMLPLIREIVE